MVTLSGPALSQKIATSPTLMGRLQYWQENLLFCPGTAPLLPWDPSTWLSPGNKTVTSDPGAT